jgi:hypothetical protein
MNYNSYYVITDDKRTDFTNHNDAYKFYCDNLPHTTYIELVGICGIIGRTLLYNSKEIE